VSHDLTPFESQSPLAQVRAEEKALCHYCGAPLSAFYYFCVGCGTPYKSLDTVISPARPRQLTDEELVRMKAPQVWTLFWSYFAVVVGVGMFTFVFFQEDRPDLHLFLNEIAILATTCVFGWMYRKSLIVQFKKIGFDSPYAYVGLGLLPALLLLNYVYHGWLIELMKDKHVDLLSKLREFGVRESSLIATFCVFPAVLEEIAYRGLAQHWLQTALPPKRAILFASALFAATHLSVLSFPYLLLVGILLGWTKYKTGSLYPSMLIHFLHNFVVIEFFFRG
jgi:uncharacterized protein